MASLNFMPVPVSVIENEGQFSFKREISLVLPAAADDDDLFAARTLQLYISAFAERCGDIEKRYANDHPGVAIVLARADRDADWLGCVPELKPQGYRIDVTPEGVSLIGADASGLFYAVQTFGQLLDQASKKLPALTITDYPALPNRGVMLDVSRGKVPTVESLMQTVDLLAMWKINQFQLYIEHTFLWPSHPEIGERFDALTPDDILAIDAYCSQRHIEFVPNLQSFGHQANLLSLKQFAHLREGKDPWTLSPAEPGTYELLDELYREFLPNFRSSQFNVDSDETWDLGKGKSAKRAEEVGLGRVYLDHILRLREMAAKYGRRTMFWGDIILQHAELIPEIPDDVVVLHWEYEPNPVEESVRKFANAGKQFYVCPGVNDWNAFFPRQGVARSNISKLIGYAVKYGAIGMLNTDWGDGGHYNLQGLSYQGYAFGASESWHPGSTESFEAAFGRFFYGKDGEAVMEAVKALERVYTPDEGIQAGDAPTLHTRLLTGTKYRDYFTREAAKVMRKSAEEALAILKKLRGRTRQPLVIAELYNAARQDLLVAKKVEIGVDFHQRYAVVKATKDIDGFQELVSAVRPRLRSLAKDAEKIPDEYASLWLARAREAGLFEVIEWQLEVAAELTATADWLASAAKAARRSCNIPDLPPIDDRWYPGSFKMQMGFGD